METQKEILTKALVVGARIRVGKEYADEYGFEEGQIFELVEGCFEHDNGLYISDVTAPSIWDEYEDDFVSIYHLFGNNFEFFMDCEVLAPNAG